MHPSLRTELAFLLSTLWPGGGVVVAVTPSVCVCWGGGFGGVPMPNQICPCHVHSNSTLQPANSHWDFGFGEKRDSKMGVRDKPQVVRNLNQCGLTSTFILHFQLCYNMCIVRIGRAQCFHNISVLNVQVIPTSSRNYAPILYKAFYFFCIPDRRVEITWL